MHRQSPFTPLRQPESVGIVALCSLRGKYLIHTQKVDLYQIHTPLATSYPISGMILKSSTCLGYDSDIYLLLHIKAHDSNSEEYKL